MVNYTSTSMFDQIFDQTLFCDGILNEINVKISRLSKIALLVVGGPHPISSNLE